MLFIRAMLHFLTVQHVAIANVNWDAPCENVSSGICVQRRPRLACTSAQSDQGFGCPLSELLDTIECMNGEQRPGWYMAHALDDWNPQMSPMICTICNSVGGLYQQPGSSNLIGWKLEVGVASWFIQHGKSSYLRASVQPIYFREPSMRTMCRCLYATFILNARHFALCDPSRSPVAIYRLNHQMKIWSRLVKTCLWACAQCANCTSSYTSGKYHPGLCSPVIHSVVANDSASGQRRHWKDCAYAQVGLRICCPHMPEDKFSYGAAKLIIFFSYFSVNDDISFIPTIWMKCRLICCKRIKKKYLTIMSAYIYSKQVKV